MIKDFFDDFEAKQKAIESNKDLSSSGKQKALAQLKRDKKAQTRERIKSSRKTAVIAGLKAKELQDERIKKTGQSRENMDYSRLNYEAMTIKAQIEADKSPEGVRELWERAKEANNVYAIKAWKDTAVGLISSLGGSDYADITGQILQDISETEQKVVDEPMTGEEIEALNELREVESDIRQLDSFYGSGQALYNRVFYDIGFKDGRIELGFSCQEEENPLTGSNRLETKEEVYYRVEREYDEKVESYSKALQDRGFDALDKDFDDISEGLEA